MDLLCVFSLLCLLCLCARLFICALWSPAGKGLNSWLSFVVSNCKFVTFPLVSWIRCGTWLYRFLIFAPLLTLKNTHGFARAPLTALISCKNKWDFVGMKIPFRYPCLYFSAIHLEMILQYLLVYKMSIRGYSEMWIQSQIYGHLIHYILTLTITLYNVKYACCHYIRHMDVVRSISRLIHGIAGPRASN